jgi:hypothetical protein
LRTLSGRRGEEVLCSNAPQPTIRTGSPWSKTAMMHHGHFTRISRASRASRVTLFFLFETFRSHRHAGVCQEEAI